MALNEEKKKLPYLNEITNNLSYSNGDPLTDINEKTNQKSISDGGNYVVNNLRKMGGGGGEDLLNPFYTESKQLANQPLQQLTNPEQQNQPTRFLPTIDKNNSLASLPSLKAGSGVISDPVTGNVMAKYEPDPNQNTSQDNQPAKFNGSPASSSGSSESGETPAYVSKVGTPAYMTPEQARERGIGWKTLRSINDRMAADYHAELGERIGEMNAMKTHQSSSSNNSTGAMPGDTQNALQQAETDAIRAKIDEGNYIKVKRQVPYGEPNPATNEQNFTTEEQLYDRKLKKFIDNPTTQTFTNPTESLTKKLLDMRNSNDPSLKAAEDSYKTKFGKLPY